MGIWALLFIALYSSDPIQYAILLPSPEMCMKVKYVIMADEGQRPNVALECVDNTTTDVDLVRLKYPFQFTF